MTLLVNINKIHNKIEITVIIKKKYLLNYIFLITDPLDLMIRSVFAWTFFFKVYIHYYSY